MDNKPIKILKTEQTPLSCFGFNPKYTMMVTGHEQVVSTAYVCDLTSHSPTTISSPVLGQVFEHWFYTGRRSLLPNHKNNTSSYTGILATR
jgi:hypothetical protein